MKEFNRGYLKALLEQQKIVDKKLAQIYAEDPDEAKIAATQMDIQLSEYTLQLAKNLSVNIIQRNLL